MWLVEVTFKVIFFAPVQVDFRWFTQDNHHCHFTMVTSSSQRLPREISSFPQRDRRKCESSGYKPLVLRLSGQSHVLLPTYATFVSHLILKTLHKIAIGMCVSPQNQVCIVEWWATFKTFFYSSQLLIQKMGGERLIFLSYRIMA